MGLSQYGAKYGSFPKSGVPFAPVMENQMQKKMENEMEMGVDKD